MKLFASDDAGTTYTFQSSGSLEELQELGKSLDESWIRWVIVDDSDAVVCRCRIHETIIRQTRENKAVMLTLDKYVLDVLRPLGLALTLEEANALMEQEKKGMN